MPPLLRFTVYRLFSTLVTLFLITLVLYGFVMLTPPEVRATLYYSKGFNPDRMTADQLQTFTESIIKQRHLRDPYPVQYILWLGSLLSGDWGWSPTLGEAVLPALQRRSAVTLELTIYTLLVFIPLGIISGVRASAHKGLPLDHRFRFAAFVAASLPSFVVGLFLMSIFYVLLHWFPPERISTLIGQELHSPDFHMYTGLLTVDGLLNGRPDISIDALRHLVLPVITLSLLQWATLGRVTRVTMIEETQKEYITAARARGLTEKQITWKHALRNAYSPALTSSALSAASLITGVFIVEVLFNFRGVSEIVVYSVSTIPDAAAVLGFAVYSVMVVLAIMLILDLLQAALDPRVRHGILS
jgi:peptide/nickel transport system permease protein